MDTEEKKTTPKGIEQEFKEEYKHLKQTYRQKIQAVFERIRERKIKELKKKIGI